MNTEYLVIGGGYFGCSIAYHLAKTGAKTLLVDQNEVISGASGANFGCVQVQDAEPGQCTEMSLEGIRLIEKAREELESDFGYRRIGSIVVAENEKQLEIVKERFRGKKEAGLAVRWLTGKELEEQEPNLAPGKLLGAVWYEQGQLWPFAYLYAYIKKGRACGLSVREHARVDRLLTSGGRVEGAVLDSGEEILAKETIVAAGSGTRAVCLTAGLDAPVFSSKSECFVTEPCRPFLRNTYSSAGFFAEAHDPDRAAASLCLAQSIHGNLLVAETTKPEKLCDPAFLDLTSPEHCENISRLALTYFPSLRDLPILRSWVTSSPCTPKMMPVFGPSVIPGLFVAAGFKSASVMSKLAGELTAEYFTGKTPRYDLSGFISQAKRI